ncbi:MAG: ISL3 family transposase [Actinobacteria bacterium]|nr:ISL3 family transposase [Actinomycetota bacterium]
MSDRIDVPLGLEGFEVMSTEVVGDVLEVHVRSTRRAACHHCGSVDVTGHGCNERRIRDRSCAFPTVLRWRQRRFMCVDCGKTCRERHPELAGRRSITNRFRQRLFERACGEPITDVASSEGVSAYRVDEAFEHHAATALVDRNIEPPRVLAIDESAFRKRFRFHTVFSDPERGNIIDLVEGRGKGSIYGGLAAMSDQVRAHIETVVMDCHWPYRQAIEDVLPNVRVVADKFHVIRSVDAAAHRVRIRHGRRIRVVGRDGGLARQKNPRFMPGVWRSRWAFMKRASKLNHQDADALQPIFEALPEVGIAWMLKEQFALIYDAPDRIEAERRLELWLDQITAAGTPEFLNTWRTLQWWREQILNYFDDRVTNAFAEGITNKIKVMKRRSYGFRDPMRYRQKVLLSCCRRPSQRG